MLYCSNYTCQTPNPENYKFCQKCRTPLTRRYLWAVGDRASAYQAGDLLDDRYLCKGEQVFLDSKPGLLSANPSELPQQFLSYLRLITQQPHIPQVYDWLVPEASGEPLLMLDQVPLYAVDMLVDRGIELPQGASQNSTDDIEIRLFPSWADAWATATPLRQLNWLWQVANLWHACAEEGVASSLLTPNLMRLEGSLLRLLELSPDKSKLELMHLGQFWQTWAAQARPEIAGFLQQLCQNLMQGQIRNTEGLLAQLDQALETVGQSQNRSVQIATRTDQGPSRPRNEDACYPSSGTVETAAAGQSPLVIVCDGIGGHQGGDVASHLAIEAIEQRMKTLDPLRLDPTTLTIELEKAACLANDQISQRNDSEQRYDRQRMGTTLVMGLVRQHELYITHVGDSRAYWITRWGCHQITLDDDVASREVRLGYSTYRQALQQPSAGSLVQALGMGSSNLLYPTVQRFILDEDSVFLLCSDGLSDNDRIEECWETDILPLLDDRLDLAAVTQRLVEVANTRNGYDNVTIGLIRVRTLANQAVPALAAKLDAPQTSTPTLPVAAVAQTAVPVPAAPSGQSTLKTQVIRPDRAKSNPLPLLLGILLLLSLGGALAYLLIPSLGDWINSRIGTDTSEPVTASSPPSASPSSTPLTTLEVGSLVQVARSPDPRITNRLSPPVLFSNPPAAEPTPTASTAPTPVSQPIGTLPIGTILKVLSKQQGKTQANLWVKVQICSTISSSPNSSPSSSPSSSPTAPSPAPSASAPPTAPSPTPSASAPPDASASSAPEAEAIAPALPTASASPAAPPSASPPASPQPALSPPAPAGQTGWVLEAEILPLVVPSASLTAESRNACSQAVTHRSSGAAVFNFLLPHPLKIQVNS